MSVCPRYCFMTYYVSWGFPSRPMGTDESCWDWQHFTYYFCMWTRTNQRCRDQLIFTQTVLVHSDKWQSYYLTGYQQSVDIQTFSRMCLSIALRSHLSGNILTFQHTKMTSWLGKTWQGQHSSIVHVIPGPRESWGHIMSLTYQSNNHFHWSQLERLQMAKISHLKLLDLRYGLQHRSGLQGSSTRITNSYLGLNLMN